MKPGRDHSRGSTWHWPWNRGERESEIQRLSLLFGGT
ncbi:unnamed protein product, partial [Vitis vinifera]